MRKVTLSELEERNKKAGRYFFSNDTMNFFGSEFVTGFADDEEAYAYFVTSEWLFDHINRAYNVRCMDLKTGHVLPTPYEHSEEWRQIVMLSDARDIMMRLLKGELEWPK